MIKVRYLAELRALRRSGHLRPPLDAFLEDRLRAAAAACRKLGHVFDWHAHGYFVVVDQGDDVYDLSAAGLGPKIQGLVGATWETSRFHPAIATWEVVVKNSNPAGLTFLIPEASWVDPGLRRRLASREHA